MDKFRNPGSGKAVRAIKYKADFEVMYADGGVEVVDVKGMMTDIFRMKAKLFMNRYGIPLVIVKYSVRKNEFTREYF